MLELVPPRSVKESQPSKASKPDKKPVINAEICVQVAMFGSNDQSVSMHLLWYARLRFDFGCKGISLSALSTSGRLHGLKNEAILSLISHWEKQGFITAGMARGIEDVQLFERIAQGDVICKVAKSKPRRARAPKKPRLVKP